jgi:hypothetical protein
MIWVPRRTAVSPSVLAVTLAGLFTACAEPTFVSLGHDIQRVARPDAGPLTSCSDSPAGDSLLSDCDDGPVEPLSCELATPGVALDAACGARRPVACPDARAGDLAPPSRVLSDLLGGCTERSHQLTVLFSSGCATAFALDPIDAPDAQAVSACVAARLGSESYACAETVACGIGSTFRIPTAFVEPDWY